MTTEQLEQEAAHWAVAKRENLPIQPLSALDASADVSEAYRFQKETLKAELALGYAYAGRKIAFTADALRVRLKLSEPAYGYMLREELHLSGSTVSGTPFEGVRLEPEIAFRLRRDLDHPGLTEQEVLDAVGAVCPAFEIVHDRVPMDPFCLSDMIADNTSFGGAVLGGFLPLSRLPALPEISVTVRDGKQSLQSGSGSDVMGSPARAVTWLANRLAEEGTPIRSGELILSGSLTPQLPTQPNHTYRAEFGPLGRVEIRFGNPPETASR